MKPINIILFLFIDLVIQEAERYIYTQDQNCQYWPALRSATWTCLQILDICEDVWNQSIILYQKEPKRNKASLSKKAQKGATLCKHRTVVMWRIHLWWTPSSRAVSSVKEGKKRIDLFGQSLLDSSIVAVKFDTALIKRSWLELSPTWSKLIGLITESLWIIWLH